MLQRLYIAALVVACLVGIWVGYTALTHRETTGANVLGVSGLAATIWAGGTIGLVLATTPAAQLRWLQISYLGIVAAPIAFLFLAVIYTGYDQSVPTPALVALIGIGVVFLGLVWTNPTHNLYWASIDYTAAVPEGIATTPGAGFWAFVVFTYGLLLVGSTLFVRYALTAPELYRIQTTAILVAVAAPWAANVPHVFQFMTADVTPLALSITNVALWVAMFRYRLTDIGPIALRTVFESISASVYVLDRRDRVVDINTAGMELFDISEDAIGARFGDIVPDDAIYEHVQEDDARGVVEVREPERSHDGKSDRRYYEVTVTPTEDRRGGQNRRVVVITDVTDNQRQQRRLEAQNERLDQFASVVSHDLRNPLSIAQGRLKLAEEECDTPHHEDIEKAHDRMGALIDDLLVLAREGESVSDPQPVDLAPLVRSCWSTVETADATLTTDFEQGVTILADESRLRQLFENLFRNAVEHGSTGSRTNSDDTEPDSESVTVTVGELEGGVYVQDDGPGIPEEDRDDVFVAGYSTSDEGTGFGLRIVKDIAEAHGWEIQVTKGSDGGARFEITGVETERQAEPTPAE
jgi:PAS domain S-box-containing protein